ncbi:MAG: endonuclease/exonuclease/phosphatase family protein [Bacteroidales bacterium]|nr:endonuclease/exonuclease/phosphatase family protein [Bacteroidales bacterium]MDD2322573.1 endonuclease/exonuclease/phosphatase family protein [Bacteroidales bacterium]MDD3011811.1 endonuclease/exonuclease/phosphatase family protein [Bacteroidales bacterium]MDD3960710.1 endonuclease/exonuclease/phosphatase family protein [Bacteroidales bacterium]MDY0286268.1 endonuclease/exonuclease/phosphatase family protein [Bacteroidales bacterium]
MKQMHFQIFFILVFLGLAGTGFAQQEKQFKVACIAFYNLENLFDTINQEEVNDFEFTPEGPNRWISSRYLEKSDNMAKVIAAIALDITPDGPAVLGVSEIENASVLEDLVANERIKARNYQIVHYDGPDRRGVDVGLLYNPKYFSVTHSQSRRLTVGGMPDFRTRDQLVVSGLFDGEPMHFIVVHWPSRYGGEKRSQPLRIAAAQLSRSIIDSLLTLDPNAKIVLMGDYNDDPNNESVEKHLKATGKTRLKDDQLYNPTAPLFKKGIGSLAYRDNWNLFDQHVITPAFLGDDYSTYKLYKAEVFNRPWLMQKEGAFKGYPYRTFSYGRYIGGYSDHLPTYLILIKEQ